MSSIARLARSAIVFAMSTEIPMGYKDLLSNSANTGFPKLIPTLKIPVGANEDVISESIGINFCLRWE